MEKGHLANYVKKQGEDNDRIKPVVDLVAPEPPAVRPAAGVIEAIHGVTDRTMATRNALRARLARAQLWSEAFPVKEVMSIVAPPKRNRNDNMVYELSFNEEDLEALIPLIMMRWC